jgi:DNA-binding MarR family transcriptional regulator
LYAKGKRTIKPQAHSNIEFGRLLWRASRSATGVYRRRVAELELTPRQAAAILALVDMPGATLRQLAEALGADQATASALIDRLLAADLVRRETNQDDRRRASLQPTDKALRLAKRLKTARRDSEEMIWQALGLEDGEELVRILSRLIHDLDEVSAVPAGGSA